MTNIVLRDDNTSENSASVSAPVIRMKDKPLVSVVIPSYNRAALLPEAIETVLQQTYQHFEIIVVDDESTDNTADIAKQYPIRYIFQKNQGVSAARNTGILASKGEYIALLDSDDRFFPGALASGLSVLSSHPECMMATGDFSFMSEDGKWMRPSRKPFIKGDYYTNLLRSNFIEMTATCLFRRDVFDRIGLFNPTLGGGEDYDLYLRIVREFPIICHPTVIAEYRSHEVSLSKRGDLMLRDTMRVVEAQTAYIGNDPVRRKAQREGRRFWRKLYGRHVAAQLALQSQAGSKDLAGKVKLLAREYPEGLFIFLFRRFASTRTNLWLKERELRKAGWVPRGAVEFGDMRKLVPIGRLFNLDRGIPIHNFYCNQFLSAVAGDIRGRVLHVGEPRERGRAGASVSSFLNKLGLSETEALSLEEVRDRKPEEGQFDCILVSDCLEYASNLDIPLALLKRLVKPGGVLLAILPGLQSGHRQGGINNLYWHFTTHSAANLFERYFGRENTQIRGFGNILTAVAALHGLTAEELNAVELENHDPAYEVSIFVRAINA
jgi:glycosyltransferase involved in cell wall biosynthesis